MSIDRIREALAAGPTPGPWTVMPANAGEQCVARINAWESVPPNGVELAHDTIDAAFIAACHPEAIRELLAAHDALKADAERYRWLRGREDGRYMTVYAFRTDVDEVCLGEELDATIDAARGASNE